MTDKIIRPERTTEKWQEIPPSFQDGFHFEMVNPARCAGLISGVALRLFNPARQQYNNSAKENFPGCKVKTVKPNEMKFRDQQLQQHFDKTIACVSGCPAEQLPILALLDAWHWFQLIEGEDSPKVIEALEKLLSPELRPALRAWYQRFGDNMNVGALQFRERLNELAGEKFGTQPKFN